MSNTTTTRSATQTSEVRLSRPYEISDWCYELGCSEDDLRRAVRAAGTNEEDVRRVLGSGAL